MAASPAQPYSESRTSRTARTAQLTPTTSADRLSPGLVPAPSHGGPAWLGLGLALVVLAALAVLAVQNTGAVAVTFLGAQGSVPLSLLLLGAAAGAALVVLVLAGVRAGRRRGGRPRGLVTAPGA